MRTLSRFDRLKSSWRFLLAFGMVPFAIACDDDADHPSQITSLRVLAVRSDEPFALPGSQPELDMLLYDGSVGATQADGTHRNVQVLWMGTCLDPAGDLYYGCYPALHTAVESLTDADLAAGRVPSGALPGAIGFGTHFTAEIPADAITRRPQAPGVISPYGLAYVFFAACAGEIRHVPGARPDQDYPVGCFRPGTDEALGQNDFEFGYSPIYVYADLVNQNPKLDSFTFDVPGPGPAGADAGSCDGSDAGPAGADAGSCDGSDAGPVCADAGSCGAGQMRGSKGVCIPVVGSCSADKSDDCPGYSLRPVVSQSSAEPALSSHVAGGGAPTETLWVNYYSTAGRFDKDARVVHDAESGWSGEYDGFWRAYHAAHGEAHLFAVVRDNRGGVVWATQDVWVE